LLVKARDRQGWGTAPISIPLAGRPGCSTQDCRSGGFMEKNRVVSITESEFIRMKGAVMDKDGAEALKLLKEWVKRLEQQENLGLKSHLG
jgi:hypothetical protein